MFPRSRPHSLFRNLTVSFLSALLLTQGHVFAVSDAMMGMCNDTGFNTDSTFVQNNISNDITLGMTAVRMGMNGVGGGSVNAAFTWAARDAVVNSYVANHIAMHVPVNPVTMVSQGSSYADWKNNYDYFVRGVMSHYQGKIFWYIIINEPDLNGVTAQQAVDFQQIAFNAARSIDPNIKIESSPVSSPTATFLNDMLQLGLADYCDYIGIHCYSSEIDDGNLSKPVEWMQALGIKKPISASECGMSVGWAPAGFPGGGQEYRRRWMPLYYLALKRYGISHSLLFSLTFNDQNWAYVDNNFVPYQPGYGEIQTGFVDRAFANGGFELSNDSQRDWVVYYDPTSTAAPTTTTFVTGDSAGAHGGSGYAKMNSGATTGSIIVRRIAGKLMPGAQVTVSAWTYINGSGTAKLKTLGYDPSVGNAETVASASGSGSWKNLSLTVTPINPWIVVEISTVGTGVSGQYVKWDDVSVTTTGLFSYEAENLTVSAKSSATHRVINDFNFSNGEATVLDANGAGDYVTYSVNVPQARTYDIRVGTKKFNTRGIFQFSSNGVNHGSPVDLYASGASYTDMDIGPVTFASSGNKLFQFLVTGKNASSSGYSLSFDYIKLVPQ